MTRAESPGRTDAQAPVCSPKRAMPLTTALVLLCAGLLAAVSIGGCQTTRTGTDEDRPDRPRRPVIGAERDEKSISALFEGRRYEREGEEDSALRAFERAIEINPELTMAYIEAGNIYRRRGDYSLAERRYGEAARVEPLNFEAQYLHGLALQLLNRLTEAVRAYLRALAIDPMNLDANMNIATAYLGLGEPRQAMRYAIRAVRIDGESGPARANLAAVYRELDEHESAVTELRQAAELMQLSPELLLMLSDSLSRTGRKDEAIVTIEEVLALGPSPVAYETLGALLFRDYRYDEAEEAFQRAIELDPTHFPAINSLGIYRLNQYLWSEKRNRDAQRDGVRLLRRSLQINPDQPRIVELVRRYGA
ncbi:MAG: tetratricopeptide repeat protein [Phycisphaerales bacterium]|nr:MAG: tetratricopeptide repeat protein [Phycisphaerales bacterium]